MAYHWTHALHVVPTSGDIPVEDNACFGFIEVPQGKKYDDTDLVVFVAGFETIGGEPFCVAGSGTLAAAAVCDVDQHDRPVVGFMNFCLDEIELNDEGDDVADDELENSVSIAIHEISHILGMNSEQLKFFRNPITGDPLTPRPFQQETFTCLNGVTYDDIILPSCNTMQSGRNSRGERYFEIVTPTVRQVTQNHFNCQRLTGARLENQPTNTLDCFGSHWDERLFYTETLSAFYSPEANYFSPLTLALLEDSGWYKANYSMSVISPFGHGAGCDFVDKDCVVAGTVPDYAKGFFCNHTMDRTDNQDDLIYTCDPSHTHKAACDLADRGEEYIPPSGKYFHGNVGVVLFERADFCPVALYEPVDCQNDQNQHHRYLGGEVFGHESLCFESKGEQGTLVKSLCLHSKCDIQKGVLEVHINREVFLCEQDFQKFTFLEPADGKTYEFECPRLAVACSHLFCPANCAGRGKCNYKKKFPTCECFEKGDMTDGCYETIIQAPSEISHTDCYKKGAAVTFSKMSLGVFMSSIVVALSIVMNS